MFTSHGNGQQHTIDIMDTHTNDYIPTEKCAYPYKKNHYGLKKRKKRISSSIYPKKITFPIEEGVAHTHSLLLYSPPQTILYQNKIPPFPPSCVLNKKTCLLTFSVPLPNKKIEEKKLIIGKRKNIYIQATHVEITVQEKIIIEKPLRFW